jgi:GNAT superfamily N-acetyltransferase
MALLELETGPSARMVTPYRSPCDIKTLHSDNLAEIQRFFASLDRRSRWSRFGHAANDSSLLTHAQNALGAGACSFGAYVDGQLRGFVDLYCCAPQKFFEAGVVVHQDWRRRGLGWALLHAAIQWVNQTSASSLRLIFPRSNWPMRQLASKANARLDLVLDDICADITHSAALAKPNLAFRFGVPPSPQHSVAHASLRQQQRDSMPESPIRPTASRPRAIIAIEHRGSGS